MLPSVADLLDIPEIRRGDPIVLAGKSSLDRSVRWVHVSELPDIGSMLAGGEVLLTTGVALPKSNHDIQRYVHDLADAEIAALFVGLGRGFDRCPDAMIDAAEARSVPLIELRSTIPFVHVTEAVHSLIVNRHMVELLRAERTHETFTTLELEGASLATILREAATLAQAPIILEDLSHRVLAYNAHGRFDEDVLFAWEERSRRCRSSERTATFEDMGWIATNVGARGETWGRLIAVVSAAPSPQQKIVVERAASAIAIHRLLERDEIAIEHDARRSLLLDILERSYASQEELQARASAVGVKVKHRLLVPVVVRFTGSATAPDSPTRKAGRDAVRAVEMAASSFSDSVLVAATSADTVALLVTRDAHESRETKLHPLAIAIHDQVARLKPPRSASIGVSSDVSSMADVSRGVLEASEIAEAGRDSSHTAPYVELPDVHVRGLLFLLRADHRVQSFVERELGALLSLDPERRRDLLEALRTYLRVGRNKSLAADELHMSRPALYHRLKTIESLLDVDLDDVEACLSLHVAIVALEER